MTVKHVEVYETTDAIKFKSIGGLPECPVAAGFCLIVYNPEFTFITDMFLQIEFIESVITINNRIMPQLLVDGIDEVLTCQTNC